MPLRALGVDREVSYPDVPFGVDMNAVWCNEHTRAEILQDCAGIGIKFEDRINQIGIAGYWRSRTKVPRTATLIGYEHAVCRIDINAGGGTPLTPLRQITPIARHYRVWVFKTLSGDDIANYHMFMSHRGCSSRHRGGCRSRSVAAGIRLSASGQHEGRTKRG